MAIGNGIVNVSALNVRIKPSATAALASEAIVFGTTVDVFDKFIEPNKTWYRIGENMWVCGIYYGQNYVIYTPLPQVGNFYRIKDDLEAGIPPRPYLRVGLPSTVRIQGGASYVNLTDAWMKYVVAVNDPAGRKYQFIDYPICKVMKAAVGWHNQGKPNRVEQLTFSGNIVDVIEIVDRKAYIKCFYNNRKPPAEIYKPTAVTLHPLVQLLSTQYKTSLDVSTNGRYPRTLIIANDESEKLWIDIGELVKID